MAAFVLAMLAVIAAAVVTGLFFAAQRRIVFAPSKPEAAVGLSKTEKELVRAVVDEHAEEDNAKTAADLELRALRLGRVARAEDASDEESAKAIQEEADRLNDRLSLASKRAALSVVELRSERVFAARMNNPTAWWLGIAVASVVSLLVLAEFSQGQRNLLDLQKKCADAKVAMSGCEDISGQVPPDASKVKDEKGKATDGTKKTTPNTSVVTALVSCANAATGQPLPEPAFTAALLSCAGLPATSPTTGTSAKAKPKSD